MNSYQTDRRATLALVPAAVGAVAAALSRPASAQLLAPRRATIVMVHGSWHWGGCFGKVANLLAQQGHAVLTPDLLSHGFDATPYQDVTSMEAYAAPVAHILQTSKEKVVLVGHSMGGVTLSYLAEKYPQKIRKLVYLTAFMVPAGKKALDYILLNAKNPAAAELFQVVSQVNDGKGLQLDRSRPDLLKVAFYGDCSDHDVRIASRNVLDIGSPVADVQVSAITAQRFLRIPRVYIECTQDRAIPIETQRLMCQEVPGAKVLSLPTSHSPFFSQPQQLADLIGAQIGVR